MNCVVYWLYDETCKSPNYHGYVGVTKNLESRIQDHRRKGKSKGWPINFLIRVLFKGTKEECFQYEIKIRPKINIGWNTAVGGPEGYLQSGYFNLGKKRTPGQRLALSIAHKDQKMTVKAIAKALATKRANGTLSPSKATIEGLRRHFEAGLHHPRLGHKNNRTHNHKISRAHRKLHAEGRGYKGGFKGPHTEETKAKIRAARAQQSPPNLGKKHTPETKAKQSELAKRSYKNRKVDHKTGRFL